MDAADFVNCLESSDLSVVKQIKELITENLNRNKDAWLLNVLVDTYVASSSEKCLDILPTVPEPHDKHLLDKLVEHLKGSQKLQALNILGHIVRHQPPWLHRIVRHQLLGVLFKCLKSETDVPILMSGVLIITALLPAVPDTVVPHLSEIFEIFTRLCAFNLAKPGNVPEVYLLHLQVGIYSLFHRLYAMYPCHFIYYLRDTYQKEGQHDVFEQTIQPMLERVRMHPLLITASRDKEVSKERWKKKEVHDIVVECSRLSLDLTEGVTEESHCPVVGMHQMRTRRHTGHKYAELRIVQREEDSRKSAQMSQLLTAGKDSMVSAHALNSSNLWSPFSVCGLSTPPPGDAQSVASQHSTPFTCTPQPVALLMSDSPVTGSSDRIKISRENSAQSIAEKRLSGLSFSISGRASNPSDPASFTGDGSVPPSPLIKQDFSGTDAPHFSLPMLAARKLSFYSAEEKTEGAATATATTTTAAAAVVDNVATKVEDSRGVEKAGSHLDSTAKQAADGLSPGQMTNAAMGPSILQLPHFIEDMGQNMEDDADDDEVSELTGAHSAEPQASSSDSTSPGSQSLTVESVQAFMKSVNRIRFNSINITTKEYKEKLPQHSRCISCPELEAEKVLGTEPESGDDAGEMTRDQLPGSSRDIEGTSRSGRAISMMDTVTVETKTTITNQTSVNFGCKAVADKSTGGEDGSEMVDCKQYFPYEHLFPMVLPYTQSLARLETVNGQKAQMGSAHFAAEPPYFSNQSPTDLLDRHIQLGAEVHAKELSQLPLTSQGNISWTHFGGMPPADEVNILRGQVLLLHNQLLFERQRRELHAKRNRRLLGRIANTTALEETNAAVQDQLRLQEDKIQELKDSLERLHEDSQQYERARDKLIYDKKLQEKSYMKDIDSLQFLNKELHSKLDKQTDQTDAVTKELQNCKARLFIMQQELTAVQAKADFAQDLQTQVESLGKELMLMGELQQKYQQRLVSMSGWQQARPETQFLLDTYKNELNNTKSSLEQKTMQLDATGARMVELEETVKQKEQVISELKRTLEDVKSANKDQLQATEDKYGAQKRIQQSLQEQVLDLHNQLTRNRKPDKPLQSVADEMEAIEAADLDSRSSEGLFEVHEVAEEATGSE